MPLITCIWKALTVVLTASLLLAPPANAQEKKKTWIPKLRAGTDETYIELYGHINKGLLVYDDGHSTLGYFPVDNDNSSTRAGLTYYNEVNDNWSVTGNLEAEWTPYSTKSVNQL